MAESTSAAKILVIDDDAYVLRSLQAILEADGYDVYTATSGQAGLTLLTEENPDLVLVDMVMPEMSGWEVCERIRHVSTVPIILLTASQTAKGQAPSPRVGANAYLFKPVSLSKLRAQVKTLLYPTRET
jgi:DNA-binding response OmpR family regulator